MNDKKTWGVLDVLVVALTILFIALKLCHIINWSWAWVLAPLWICGVVAGIVLLVAVAIVKRRKR